MFKKTQKIEELCEEIRDLIDQGFYAEDYLNFARKIENKLSEIEILSSEILSDVRKIKDEVKK